ncbi:MAG: MFS transporter [Desulfomonile tiedjei]|uniref:MFS transporter n=1 Tax=Desulfomonile tiedjei TaxID=2358 RepID=A0A9D6Z8F6_9BACT|nr:MFS transporter [Desulfomonile tiedjei]
MDNGFSNQRTFNLKMLLILSLGHLVTDIYQGSLPAILPFLKDKLSLSYAMAGAIMMASNLTSSVIQPLFGYLSDRKEKAFLLPFGCVAAGVGLSLISIPADYVLVLLLVIVSGLGVASFHPEGYKTAHFFTGDKMATGMSVFSVGGNLGFALGPIISLFIITQYGFDFLPVMIVFSFIFVSLLFYAWKSLAPAQSMQSGTGNGLHENAPKGAYVALFMIIGTVVMRSWTQMGLMAYIPFYYIEHLKGEPIFAGKLMSIFLLGGVVGTLIGSFLADRWGHKLYLVLSLILTSLLFPLIFVAEGFALFVALGVVGMTLISSFTVTIVMAQQLLPKNLGIASGLMVGFAIGTGGIGVTLLGLIADHFGVPIALKSIMVLPLVGVVMSLFIKYPGQVRR